MQEFGVFEATESTLGNSQPVSSQSTQSQDAPIGLSRTQTSYVISGIIVFHFNLLHHIGPLRNIDTCHRILVETEDLGPAEANSYPIDVLLLGFMSSRAGLELGLGTDRVGSTATLLPATDSRHNKHGLRAGIT